MCDKVCDTSHMLVEFVCCVWVQYAWHRAEGGTLLVGREEPAAQFNPSFLPPTPSLSYFPPTPIFHFRPFLPLLLCVPPTFPTHPWCQLTIMQIWSEVILLAGLPLNWSNCSQHNCWAAPLERGWNWPEFKLAAYIGLGNQGNWITNPRKFQRWSIVGALVVAVSPYHRMVCKGEPYHLPLLTISYSTHLCSPQSWWVPSLVGPHLTEFSLQTCLLFFFMLLVSWMVS